MFTKLGKLSFVTVLLKNMGGNNDPGGHENDEIIQDDNSKFVDSIVDEINNDDSNLIMNATWLVSPILFCNTQHHPPHRAHGETCGTPLSQDGRRACCQ